MKILITITALVMFSVLVFLSCGKDNDQTNENLPPVIDPLPTNKPPVARAGPDTTIVVALCTDKTNTELDGSGSTDPEGKTLNYVWSQLRGPDGTILSNPQQPKTKVENLSTGQYAFELSVKDAGDSIAKDTVLIIVKGTPKEYDVDLTVDGTFSFTDNYKDCYYDDCTYSDFTIIEGKGILLPIGELSIYFSEHADTANLSYAPHSNLSIYSSNVNNTYVHGTTAVNLKKLFQQGGGAFNGTVTINGGSANNCNPDMVFNYPPLNITGSLDTTFKKAIVRIKGKTFF